MQYQRIKPLVGGLFFSVSLNRLESDLQGGIGVRPPVRAYLKTHASNVLGG